MLHTLLPREDVANGSTEAVEHEHRDTHESKLPKWIPHEYLDGVFKPSAPQAEKPPMEHPKPNDHPNPSEREEDPVERPAHTVFRVSVPDLAELGCKFAS